jgi:hypothetical protein
MIDKSSALKTVLNRLASLPVGHAVELRTYKRNRGAIIGRVTEDGYLLVEQGYEDRRMEVDGKGLRQALKGVLKREFPRSRKIRLYNLGERHPDQAAGPPGKVL